MQTPDIVYGPLFEAVQSSEVFPDSKTFVDATPQFEPAAILEAYAQVKDTPDFNLETFVRKYFTIPEVGDSTFKGDPARPVEEHIELLWPILQRAADQPVPGSSLLPLPNPYIVPGGRFGEIYYWDSYFTMLGLAVSGHTKLIGHMIDNFAHLIHTIGHIPNGNRSYFTTRSQPPFFTLMVLLLDRLEPESGAFARHLEAIEKEYAFWMDGEGDHDQAYRRVVHLEDGIVLNRYWDDVATPRQESYIEDVHLASQVERPAAELCRDLRAACESGWDFSARWLADPNDLGSIEATQIVPVDLNCLLYSIEVGLEKCYSYRGDEERAKEMEARIVRRVAGIEKYCWSTERNVYCDYQFIRKRATRVDSLAMAFPLFTDFAPDTRAAAVKDALMKDFLKDGGLISTNIPSGQQWDAPNGWAPLQWIAYQALQNYGYEQEARTCAQKWVDNCIRVYQNTGKLVEKYDVTNTALLAGGGEYPVQDGFGWTNGVLLAMMDELEML